MATYSSTVDKYHEFHDGTVSADEKRKNNYTTLVDTYYDLATDFYEYGWGQSFHFASPKYGESYQTAILRHEHWLAMKIGLKPGMKIIDVGCGGVASSETFHISLVPTSLVLTLMITN